MGKDYERYYEKAKAEYGIEYIRSAISSIKELQQTKNLLITYVKEDGTFEEREFDAVVLSVGFIPPQTIKDLAGRMGLQLNQQGFCQTGEFNPAQTSVKGIFVAGAFRGPRDIPETVVEGSSAAASAASFRIGRSSAHSRTDQNHIPLFFEPRRVRNQIPEEWPRP